MSVCMFTGHRLQNLPFGFNENDKRCIALKKKMEILIREKIEKYGVVQFLTGMALGIDCFAAEIVIDFGRKYNGISLTAVVPCREQTIRWRQCDVIRYNAILARCSNIVLLQEKYTKDCMNKRNLYMVEHSDCVIAVWNGSGSGTGNTVKYAFERGLPVTVLNPVSLKIDYR